MQALTKRLELQFKAPYGVSEMYVTPRNFGSEVFFYIKCDKIYYN